MNQHHLKLFITIAAVAIVALYGIAGWADRFSDAAAQGGVDSDPPPSSTEPGADHRGPVDAQQIETDLPPGAPDGLSLTSFRIAGSTLRPRENDVDYNTGSASGCIYASSGDSSTVWNAPVWLPPGATVHSLRIYYDDTASANTVGWFTIYDLYGNVVDEWSVSSVGSNGNGFQDSVVIDHPIDYSLYSYALNWRPESVGEGIQLCGFRIFYQAPLFPFGFLPAIAK